MRNLLIALAIVLVFPLAVSASPFLTCDPQAGVFLYEAVIEQDGAFVMGGNVVVEPGAAPMYDLEGIANGTYNARLRAGNLWGWSDWSLPFGFVVERCSQPTGVVIVP